MVIQITYGTPNKTDSKIYRDVVKGKNLAQYVESFYANRDFYQWGTMVQFKGKEIIKLHSFGKKQ